MMELELRAAWWLNLKRALAAAVRPEAGGTAFDCTMNGSAGGRQRRALNRLS
jgi:hypothetical protein